MKITLLVIVLVFLTSMPSYHSIAQENTDSHSMAKSIEVAKIGKTKNVHRSGNLYFAGQFSPTDIDEIGKLDIERIITLRTAGEIDWDEKKLVEEAGIQFIHIPFRKPDSLNDELFDKVRKLLQDQSKKTLFHCGSANRVGGVWLPFRVLDQKVDIETAKKEAETIGLKTPFIKQKALDYIKRNQRDN